MDTTEDILRDIRNSKYRYKIFTSELREIVEREYGTKIDYRYLVFWADAAHNLEAYEKLKEVTSDG